MLDRQQIMQIIPHRPPFLLIDWVEDYVPGEYAVAYKDVSLETDDFLSGHFPGMPVMPGVLMIEALAQTGAVAILSHEKFAGKIAYFGGVSGAKFRRMVTCGETLRLETSLTRLRGSIGMGKGVATVGGERACEAEFMFIVRDPEQVK